MRNEKTNLRMERMDQSNFSRTKWRAALWFGGFALFVTWCAPSSFAVQSPDKLSVSPDWRHWTKAECTVILNKSGWAGELGYAYGNELVQLRSALPIREALLRQLQLKKHYDKMSPEKKLVFDQKNPSDMTENENNPIVLYAENDAVNEDYFDFDYGPSTRHTNPAQPTQVALQLADGSLIMPIKTEALQDDTDKNRFVYSFPRITNGMPVLTANSSKLRFVFGKRMEGGRRIRALQDPKKFKANGGCSFPINELMYKGKLEY